MRQLPLPWVMGWAAACVAAEAAAASPAQLPLPPQLPKEYRAVAILPLQVEDAAPGVTKAIEAGLTQEIDELRGYQPIAPSQVVTALHSYDLDPDSCLGDIACVARAGRYAGAHLALESQLVPLAGGSILSLRLIDTQSRRSVVRVAEPISTGRAATAVQLHRLIVQLFAPDSYVGSLVVECTVDGASVYLDDNLVGTTPLPALLAVRAGRHILRISKAGLPDFNGFADVVYRRRVTVEVDFDNGTITRRTVAVDSAAGVGTLIVLCAEPEIVARVDGEPIGLTPFARPVEVAAGTRQIVLRKEGLTRLARRVEIRPDRRSQLTLRVAHSRLEIVQFEIVALDAPLPEIDILAASLAPSHGAAGGRRAVVQRTGPTWRLWAGLTAAGLGAVSLGVMGYFTDQVLSANLERDAFAFALLDGEYTDVERDDLKAEARLINERGGQAAMRQWVAMGVGIGLLAAGGGLVLWDLFGPGESATTAVTSPQVSAFFFGGGGYVTVATPF